MKILQGRVQDLERLFHNKELKNRVFKDCCFRDIVNRHTSEDIFLIIYDEGNLVVGYLMLFLIGQQTYRVHFGLSKKHRRRSMKAVELFRKWCNGKLDDDVALYCTVPKEYRDVRIFCIRIGMLKVVDRQERDLYRITVRELTHGFRYIRR